MPSLMTNNPRPFTWLAFALFTAVGCGGASTTPHTPERTKTPAAQGQGSEADDGRASVIATVTGGTLGPYIGYGSNGALALYAPPAAEGEQRRWLVQRIDAEGEALGDALDIGSSPEDVPFAVLRESTGGYLALWVRQIHRADVLEGVLLGEQGSLVGDIVTISQARGEVVWADAFPTSKGTVVLWTEQTGDRAKLKRVVVDDKGVPRGNGEVLLHDARAWEAIGLDDGVAIALVVASDQDPALGAVVLLRLDAEGKALGEPVPVSKSAAAQLDVSMVRTSRSLLLAWTDRGNTDSLVHAAAMDLTGRLMVAPRAPLPPQGDQALVALLEPPQAQPNQALLVWEELPSRPKGPRALRLANLSAEAVVSERTTSLSFTPVGRPLTDFSTASDGFVLLTRAPVCDESGACGKRRVPWYLRLSPDLTIDGGAPLLVDALDREPPALVWSPGCTSSACLALAVGGQDPARVVTVRLPKDVEAPGMPARELQPPTVPLPLSNRPVHVAPEPLSEIDAARVGKTTYVGWITHFVEGLGAGPRTPPPGAPGDPNKPMAAQLAVQRVDEDGSLRGDPSIVSVRAMSAGGVAVAPSKKADEVCVAWVARDNGDPQLFLTRVGSDGKTKLQRMITRAKGDAADAAIAPLDDGWVVAWVDWRDGNGEVYATRVNSMLVRLTPEVRLTDAPGDASDVSLAVVGDEVIVAYGDSRDHPNHAMANPYVQKLRTSNLQREGDEHRIATSALHAKGVQVSRAGEEVVMAWVAQAPEQGAEAARAGARITRLDVGSLRPIGDVGDLGWTQAPVSLRVTCEPDVCRGAAMLPIEGGTSLEAFSWFPNTGQAQRGRLARASGPSAADVAPVTLGDQVFFVGQSLDGDNRIRRVHVKWLE